MRNTMNDKDIDEGRITEIEEQHKNERLSLGYKAGILGN